MVMIPRHDGAPAYRGVIEHLHAAMRAEKNAVVQGELSRPTSSATRTSLGRAALTAGARDGYY